MSFPVIAGIDLGGTKTSIAIADLEGRILEQRLERTETESCAAALQEIAVQLSSLLAGLSGAELCAIGAGAPGVSPRFEEKQALPQVQLAPGWTNIAFEAYLHKSFGIPVAVENDTNLAALGEAWRGAGSGSKNLIFIGIGTMIGGGIILNGQVYQGAHGGAGELGFIVTRTEYANQQPNGEGCLEHYCGGLGIARRAQQALQRSASADPVRYPDAAAVFAAAASGDSLAQAIVDEVARELGSGIATAIAVLDPELVIVGGGVARAGEQLLAPLRQTVKRLAPFNPPVVAARLGGDAGLYGALKLALDHLPAAT